MTTLTWLHLSDLHFRESDSFDESVVLTPLFADIENQIRDQALQPDLIFVSGDIAFSSTPAQYKLAREFFKRLLSVTQLPKERLFIVPGNHDVDRTVLTPLSTNVPQILVNRDITNGLLGNEHDRVLVLRRFRHYRDLINKYINRTPEFDHNTFFYTHIIPHNDWRIGILELNSAWLAAGDKDESNLVLGERQVRTALAPVQSTDLRIALMHHPFTWLKPFEQNDSTVLLKEQCDFILHGHLHTPGMEQLSGLDDRAMVIAGGACYESRRERNSYNFIQLDLDAGVGTVHLRAYTDEHGGRWIADTRTYQNTPQGTFTFNFPAELKARFLPRIVETHPRDGMIRVGRQIQALRITFNRAMVLDPNWVSIWVAPGDFDIAGISATYEERTRTFTIRRANKNPLPPNTTFTVKLNEPGDEAHHFRDVTGRRVAPMQFKFTTGE
jgi:predicted phosphodiesterase